MYLEFFNLKKRPFSLSPNPEFLFNTPSHREAYSQMVYAITEDSGFMMLTGEVGTGKTLLINHLMEDIPQDYQIVKVHFTMCTAKALLQGICNEFGLPYLGRTRSELVLKLQEYLKWCYSEGNKSVVILDEAQNLSRESLEIVRLLSNVEAVHEKFFQILLVGQPELSAMLAQSDLRQLRERIGLRFRLEPLSREETKQYITHRLTIAGKDYNDTFFTDGALNRIYGLTKGVPRRINILCNNALLVAYATDARSIDSDLVDEASFDETREKPNSPLSRTQEIEHYVQTAAPRVIEPWQKPSEEKGQQS